MENEVGEPNAGSVLVKMEYTVVSGETERACILGMNNTSQRFPMSLGSCGVGYVEKVGEKVESKDVSSLEVAFVIITAMGLGSVRKLELELGESAMVMGQGLHGIFSPNF